MLLDTVEDMRAGELSAPYMLCNTCSRSLLFCSVLLCSAFTICLLCNCRCTGLPPIRRDTTLSPTEKVCSRITRMYKLLCRIECSRACILNVTGLAVMGSSVFLCYNYNYILMSSCSQGRNQNLFTGGAKGVSGMGPQCNHGADFWSEQKETG